MAVTAKQIIESIPARFRVEKAAGYTTTFYFDISGSEQLQYTVSIADSTCSLTQGLVGKSDCTIQADADAYAKLETGQLNPQEALKRGDVKVSDLGAMIRFTKCFRKFGAQNEENTSQATEVVRKQKQGPLAGVQILDFTRLLPGPLGTMFLADLGADVIKIEDCENPDYIRDFTPAVNGMSMYYLALNRSKRSLAINYLSASGKQIILDLVKNADVLVEQFRPGVMDKLGFGFEALSKINPKLIYVSVTGYGQDSSLTQAAGHDLNYIAIAGALGITGKEKEITIPGFQLGDIAGGSYMVMNAVTAALYQREKTGKGDWVDVAMTDASLPFSVLQFTRHQADKKDIPRGSFELSGDLANYNIYRCSDDKFIALGSLEPKFWSAFCAKVERPDWDLVAIKKGTELRQLKFEVRNFFLSRTRDEWVEFFKDTDICLTPVNELADLENDTYLNERKMFLENEHPLVGKYKTINQPLKFKQTIFDNNWSAPDLGADTLAILRELNYTEEQIANLKENAAIKF